ncbi:MAG: HlyD family efflux transporter periplasmic adaptor subunit [Rhodothermales bacterium]|nr:HlyD family efflux transporter periplasmic adaptor subunit [Rhodothermales bacterium]
MSSDTPAHNQATEPAAQNGGTKKTERRSIAPLLAPRGSTAAGGSSGGSSGPGGPDASSSMGGGEGMDRKIERRFWNTRRIMMAVGVILFIALIAWGISTTTGGRRLNVDRERVTIATVERIPFQENISANGNVLPETTVFLDAVEGGRIEEIFVQEGAVVEQGQPILRLSNPGLQLQVLQTEQSRIEQINRLEQTRFQVEQNNLRTRQEVTDMEYNIGRLKRELDRLRPLHEKQLVSDQEFQRIQDEYDYYVRRLDLTLRGYRADSLRQTVQIRDMEAAVDRMDENFELVNQRLANLTLKAPVAGQLSALDAELGELKTSGFRFGQIDMLDGVKVRASIDEYHIDRVVRGQRAVTVNAIDGAVQEMVVRRVYPEVVNGRFEIDLDFVGEDPAGVRRGQTIRFKLEMSNPEEAIVVPLGGFFQTTGGNWIYIVDESGDFAVRQPISIGRKNTEVYEVLEGLQPGDRVVTSSYDTFNEADRLVFQ